MENMLGYFWGCFTDVTLYDPNAGGIFIKQQSNWV